MKISSQSYLLFLLLCLTSCFPSSPIEIRPTMVHDITPIAAELPPSEATVQPTVEPTLLPTITLAPTIAPTVTPLPVPTEPLLAVLDGCPVFVQELPDDLGFDGDILLHDGSDIWKLSATSPHLQAMGIPNQAFNRIKIVSDGTQLYWSELPTGDDYARDTVVVYDTLEQTTVRILPPDVGDWLEFIGWTESGQLKYRTKYERIYGEGIQEVFILFDPLSGLTETITETLNLPNYSFIESDPFTGHALIDPTGDLVLYTARDQEGPSMILLDINQNTILWQRRVDFGLFPTPQWAIDGHNVLLGITTSQYIEFISLTREGQEEVLPLQPYPGVQELIPRYTHRSPDQRFIHYRLRASMNEGPGYIVDTTSNEAWEICEPDMIFVEGEWVSETNQFIYLIRNEQGEYFLRLLDVLERKSYPLFQTTNDFLSQNVIGWTGSQLP